MVLTIRVPERKTTVNGNRDLIEAFGFFRTLTLPPPFGASASAAKPRTSDEAVVTACLPRDAATLSIFWHATNVIFFLVAREGVILTVLSD